MNDILDEILNEKEEDIIQSSQSNDILNEILNQPTDGSPSFPAGTTSQINPPSMTNEAISPMIPPVQLGTPPDVDRFVPPQFKVPELQTNELPNVGMTEKQSLVPNINPQTSGITDRNGKFYFTPKPSAFGSAFKNMTKEISKAERNERVIYANNFKVANNAVSRGMRRADSGFNLLATLIGADPVTAAKRIAENNRITPEQPPEIRAGLERIMKSETWREALVNVTKEPQALLSVFGESLPQMASSLGIFATGSLAGQPYTGAALAGLNTTAISYAQVMLEELQKTGIDINNDEQVIAKFQDQAFWDEFRGKALQYGIPIGIFDALSMGFAGKLVQLAPKGVINKAIASTGEVGMQALFGAGGEYTGQKTQELFGNRPEGITKGEVVVEGAVEGILGPVEVSTNVASANAQAKQEKQTKQARSDFIDDRIAQMSAIKDLDGSNYSAASPNVSVSASSPVGNIDNSTSLNIPQNNDTLFKAGDNSAQPVVAKSSPELSQSGTAGQSFSQQPESTNAPNQIKSTAAITANPQRTDKPLPVQEVPNKPIVQVLTPDRSMKVSVKPVVVELSSLTVLDEQGAFQDRSRSAEAMQTIRENASRLTPQTMLDDAMTDRGSPIIGKDGTVLSGNGRAMMMDLVFTEGFESQRKEYLDTIQEYGVNIEGFEKPILVRQMQDDMTLAEVKNFTRQSNIDDKTAMTATETSARDADTLTPDVILAYEGESLKSQNAPFVKSFIEQVVPRAERSEFVQNGVITDRGIQRVESAIFSYAYGERKDLIDTIITNTQADNNIKALGTALKTTAIEFAKVKANIQKGIGDQTFDIAPDIANAAATISNIRLDPNKTIEGFLETQATMDFGETDNAIEKALVKAFHHKTEAGYANKSIKDLTSFARYYSEFALEQKQDDFANQAGDKKPTPIELIERATAKVKQVNQEEKDAKKQRSLLDEGKSGDASIAEDGKGKQKPTGNRSSGRFEASNRAKGKELDNETVRVDANLRPEKNETGEKVSEASGQTGERPPGRGKGKPAKTFEEEYNVQRQSVFLQAYENAVKDDTLSSEQKVEKALNLSPREQVKILSKLVKDTFGLKYLDVGENNTKNGVDQMLDMYRNLQFMNSVLGMPNSLIGLDKGLGIAFAKRAAYLGAYFDKGTNTSAQTRSDLEKSLKGSSILFPGRFSTFAHEWGHALDYYLLHKYTPIYGRGLSGGLRGTSKKDIASDLPSEVQQAFGRLLSSLYYDQDARAAKILGMKQELLRLNSNMKNPDKPPKRIKTLERLIEEEEKYISNIRLKKTKVAENVKDSDYLSRPTEMFARAFEAYVAHKVENAGGTNEFLGAANYAYETTLKSDKELDQQFATAYPKEEERARIFVEFDNLFETLGTIGIIGKETAELPSNSFIFDQKKILKDERKVIAGKKLEKLSLFEKVGKAAKHIKMVNTNHSLTVKQIKEKETLRPKEYGKDLSAFNRASISATNGFFNPIIESKKAILFTLSARYKAYGTPKGKRASEAIEELISRLTTDPGGNRLTTEGGAFEYAVNRNSRRWQHTYKDIITKYNVDTFTVKQLRELRLLLTSDPETLAKYKDINPKIQKAAAAFRRDLFNPMHTYLNKAGISDLNYYPDRGYMPRILDKLLVLNSQDDFLYGNSTSQKRGAVPLFRDVIFPSEYGYDTETDIDVMEEVAKLGNSKKLAVGYPGAKTPNQISNYRKKFSELRKLQKDEDTNEQEIIDLQDQLEEEYKEIYSLVKNAFGEAGGKNWYTRIQESQGMPLETMGVQGSFYNKRKLPAEADTYMEKFYLDPIDAIAEYIPAVVRKAEFEQRFGAKNNVPKGYQKRDKGMSTNPRNYIDYISEVVLPRLDVTEGDINQVRDVAQLITGTFPAGKDSALRKAGSHLHAVTTMALLPRAVISSIAEPFTVTVQTGNFKDGFKNMAGTFDEAFAMVSKNAKERKLLKQQLARVLGIVDDPSVGQLVANRLGGTFADDPKSAARLGRFFIRSGLVGVTNAQRRSSMKIGFQFFAELSNEYINGDANQKKRASDILSSDYGVQPKDLKLFTDYMVDAVNNDFKMPNAEDMTEVDGNLSEIGDILSNATLIFVDSTIQDPKASERPKYAEHPLGRIVYGIMGFSRAFTRNILIYTAKKWHREGMITQDDYINGEITMTKNQIKQANLMLKAMAPIATLFVAHFVVSTAREYFLGNKDWELEDEEDRLARYLLLLGISRSGLTGGLDPIFNSLLSLKYQRDLANLMAGAGPSYILQSIERLTRVAINNSPNTVSAEYQFYTGLYQTIGAYAIVMGASSARINPLLDHVVGAGAAVVTSPAFRHFFVRNIVKAIHDVEYYPVSGVKKPDSNKKYF